MAVYIGSGLDIIPVLMYKEIKEFTFIDSQPQCEFGMFGYMQISWSLNFSFTLYDRV